ncbi:MAG: hypothetical protein JWQ14_3163 [Adhaeribacter sp.]|nr:hypothetical protein [Adhaeribacter sp.]
MKGEALRTIILLILFSLQVTINACRPKQSGNIGTTLPANASALPSVAHSGTFFARDGLDFNPLNTGTFDQFPAELTAILNKKVPGWSLPHISSDFLKQDQRNSSGPYHVQTDLNQDNMPDFAVQYLFKDTLYITAFLNSNQGNLLEYPLAKYAYDAEELKKEESKLFLSLLSKGKEILVDSVKIKKKMILPQNAILVKSDKAILYYFDNQRFDTICIHETAAL